jgi:predicted secreted protein
MPIGWFTAGAIYLVCWWIVLFAVLPLGMSQADMERPTDGGQWGAPADPKLKQKFLTTTWVSAVVWLLIMVILATGLIPLPQIG